MLEVQSQKNQFTMQFLGKLPGISEIKYSSTITCQNSTKFETKAPISLCLEQRIVLLKLELNSEYI